MVEYQVPVKDESVQKKVWAAPRLTVYGSVQDITECNKEFGVSDGNTFGQNQQPIVCS